jgi:hypothetical protein
MPPYPKSNNVAGEIAWKLWFQPETDTLDKIKLKMDEMGIVSNRNKPYSRFGLSIVAWKYACEHIEEAKNDFRKRYEDENIPWNQEAEENFYRKLVSGATHNYYGKSFDRWITENNLEQYRKYVVYRR